MEEDKIDNNESFYQHKTCVCGAFFVIESIKYKGEINLECFECKRKEIIIDKNNSLGIKYMQGYDPPPFPLYEVERARGWCDRQDWERANKPDFPFGPIPHWVKCSEHPPQKGAIYLLYQTFPEGTMFNLRANPLKRTEIHIGGLRCDGKFVSIYDQFSEEGIKHITHYMPLPESPKE